MTKSRFKLCRRLNLNTCGHPKAMKRENSGQARDKRRLSPYGIQLLEKQRLRAYYEIMEKQFRRYVKNALKSKEQTGDALIKNLECRLDNMVYRMNFSRSVKQARQMVTHGHFLVNGKKVDKPSYIISEGDVVSLKEKSRNVPGFKDNFLENHRFTLPYISLDQDNYSGKLERYPLRDEIPIQIDDHLIVEFYSKIM